MQIPRYMRGESNQLREITMSNIERARHIKRTLGTYKAARFLAKRGWSIESALWILIESGHHKKGGYHAH